MQVGPVWLWALLCVALIGGCAHTIPVNSAPDKVVAAPTPAFNFREVPVTMERVWLPLQTKWVNRVGIDQFVGDNFRNEESEQQEKRPLFDGDRTKAYLFDLKRKAGKSIEVSTTESLVEMRRAEKRTMEVTSFGMIGTTNIYSLAMSGNQPTLTRGVLLFDGRILSIFPHEKPSSETLPVGYDIREDSKLIARVDATRTPRVWLAKSEPMSEAMAGGFLTLLMRSVY